jgi:hypothetical protein
VRASAPLRSCSFESDIAFFKSNRLTAKKMIQACLIDNAGLPQFAVPCMVAHGMTVNCSQCWCVKNHGNALPVLSCLVDMCLVWLLWVPRLSMTITLSSSAAPLLCSW